MSKILLKILITLASISATAIVVATVVVINNNSSNIDKHISEDIIQPSIIPEENISDFNKKQAEGSTTHIENSSTEISTESKQEINIEHLVEDKEENTVLYEKNNETFDDKNEMQKKVKTYKTASGNEYAYVDEIKGWELTKVNSNNSELIIDNEILNEPVKKISINSFNRIDAIESVFIPSNVSIITFDVFYLAKGQGLIKQNIIIDPSNQFFVVKNNFFIIDQRNNLIIGVFGVNKTDDIVIPDGVTEILSCNLHNVSFHSLAIPASVTYIDYHAIENSNSEFIYVSSDNKDYCSVDGALYSKDLKTLFYCPPYNEISDFYVPQTVETINTEAFRTSKKVKNIFIPSSVISVGLGIANQTMNPVTLHCQAASKPAGWDSKFDYRYDGKPVEVIWGETW